MKICAVVLGNVNTLFSKARSRGVHFMALNSKCTDVGALAVRCADRRPRRRSSHFSCVPSQIHLISRLSSPSFACIEYAFLPEEETTPYPSCRSASTAYPIRTNIVAKHSIIACGIDLHLGNQSIVVGSSLYSRPSSMLAAFFRYQDKAVDSRYEIQGRRWK
jgi:hypothetical protein